MVAHSSACTCAMLRRAARRATQLYDQAMRPAGIRLTQYSVLTNVARGDGMSITELADRLGMDRSTLTRNLGPLVRSGWIHVAAGSDSRQRAVFITAQGRTKFEEAFRLWQAAEQRIRRAMGRREAAQLRALLDRVPEQGTAE